MALRRNEQKIGFSFIRFNNKMIDTIITFILHGITLSISSHIENENTILQTMYINNSQSNFKQGN